MKKKLKKLAANIKKVIANIREFLSNIRGFFNGFWQLHVSQKDIIYSFSGMNHFKMAKKYADKRFLRNGLKHYVIPAGKGSEQLVVFNSREMKQLKRLGLMQKRVTIAVLLSEAYYWAPNKDTKDPKPVNQNLLQKVLAYSKKRKTKK